MARSVAASINPELLKWARKYSGLDLAYVAEKCKLDPQTLDDLEADRIQPTLAQLRQLAKIYHFPIAVFYLPQTPDLQVKRPKDRRFLPGFEYLEPSAELNYEFRKVCERREIAIELLANISNPFKKFDIRSTLQQSPENVGTHIRKLLGISISEQMSWRDARLAFNSWRNKIESLGILVFQSTNVPLSQMRGFSLFYQILPVITVNRKDAYVARSFTLMHELAHIMLRTESLCDMREGEGKLSEADQRIEVFCNSVAACALVPRADILADERLHQALEPSPIGDAAIRDISISFGVSREVIVRRLLTLGLVDEAFYRGKRSQYEKEHKKSAKSEGGFVPPALNILSSAGRPFVSLTLENLERGIITTSDASDYLGIRLKHFEKLQSMLFGA